MNRTLLKIKRQATAQSENYWEIFEVYAEGEMTILQALEQLRRRTTNKEGKPTSPVAFNMTCSTHCNGSCGVVVNHKPVLACRTLLSEFGSTLKIKPLKKFPVIRDLIVSRDDISRNIKKLKQWSPFEGLVFVESAKGQLTIELSDKRFSEAPLAKSFSSACLNCGLCMEVCPQSHEKSAFAGASNFLNQLNLISQNLSSQKEKVLVAFENGALHQCGHYQQCQTVCPEGLPLIEGMARLSRKSLWENP